MIQIGSLQLPDRPLLLAPMEDVSDPPFRRLCRKHGADMLYTEFISADGLIRDADKSVKKLDIFPDERPVGIQIFGGDQDAMVRSAEIVERAGPELLDINYGCPVKNVVCRGAGSAILKDIDKMVSLTASIVKATKLPVTVKTRLGWDDNSIKIVEVAERLQDVGIQALSVHCRTRHQMYKGSADWSWIARIKENQRIRIPIFGNGDIDTPEKALSMLNDFGADGVMIGRAAIGYPFVFREMRHFLNTGNHLPSPGLDERLDACLEHLRHSLEWKGLRLGILEMRRHYGPYFSGLPQVKQFRSRLVQAEEPGLIEEVLEEMKVYYRGMELAPAVREVAGYAGMD